MAEPIPTAAVRVVAPLPPPWASENAWARALRLGDTPVVARVQGGAVLFDLRAIEPTDDPALVKAVRATFRTGSDRV